jgi:O-methyltransferase
MNLFKQVRRFENKKIDPTIINDEQLDYLVLYLLDALENKVEGDVVEFGCYVGESSKYLRKSLVEYSSNKELYVYDSFEGLPPVTSHEENTGWKEGGLKTTEEVLTSNFLANDLKPPIITKGWFKDIKPENLPEKISFAFLDGDFYSSIYDSLRKIFNRVEDGGYICFHDYERNDLPGVKAAIEDFFGERGLDYKIIKVCDQLAIIQKNKEVQKLKRPTDKLTIVTGLWNIGRNGRSFDHYLDSFEQLLLTKENMFIFVPQELESFVWERRQTHNTVVKVFGLEDIKQLFSPFWDRAQAIRNSEEWKGLSGWMATSPQGSLEYYNPIVMSKMSMLHDATVYDPFNSDNFIWIDGGITNTIGYTLLSDTNFYEKLTDFLDPFLFVTYPYPYHGKGVGEIHGFEWESLNSIAGTVVEWIGRGGLFGGKKEAVREAHVYYWHMLNDTLSKKLMGTEESLFSILAAKYPHLFRSTRININGHIQEFVQKVLDGVAELEPIPETHIALKNNITDISKLKVSIYMLTFNFPHQVEHTIKTWLKHPKFLTETRNILIDNSTNDEARLANKELCDKYGFEHIITNENTGINGGRFRAAQHFQESDSDYYLFLEDDMGIHPPEETGFCRNGLRYCVDNLYDKLLKIMERSEADFLKLSFTEVYMDNNIQVAWYNVPQHVRSEFWPDYNTLPTTGLDPNCPRTEFNKIEFIDGLGYITGDIYYANWPTICGKKGNQKMFLDITWERPYEQTWMSYMFQETKKGNLKPAILLASPIHHNRIAHYTPEERREN